MATNETLPKIKTLGGTSLVFELMHAAVQLTVCRSSFSTKKMLKKLLSEVSVSDLLVYGLYEYGVAGKRSIMPPMNIMDEFRVDSATACVLIWNFPTAGLVITACCAKPRHKNDTLQKDALAKIDLSAMLIKHFFKS